MIFEDNNIFKFILISIYILISFSTNATAKKWEITIQGYISGFKVGESTGIFELKEGLYKLEMKSTTTGITKIIYPWIQTVSITGKIDNTSIKPTTYKINDYRENNKKGHMHINYINFTPKIISAQPNPSNDTRRDKVPEESKKKSFDPVTSIIVIGSLSFKNKCNINIPIFDGRRRFDIQYSNISSKNDELMCKLKINRIAGYSKKELKKHPKRGLIKLVKLSQDTSFYFPKEVKVPLTIGSFLVKLDTKVLME